MEEHSERNLLMLFIVIINIVIPVLMAFQNLEAGGFLLVVGILFVARSFSVLRADARRGFNMTFKRKSENAAGKTILVQIVDDFGRDLSPQEVERRLTQAMSKAGPRDYVVPAKFKVKED